MPAVTPRAMPSWPPSESCSDAARIGGEEFVILRVGTDEQQAMEYAERIRAEVAWLDVPAVPTRVTASFGMAQLEEGEDGWDLMLRADEALYRSKEEGRNQVTRSHSWAVGDQ